jgi:hypothetical protein
MKTTPALASIAVVLLATPLHSGGIKKWIDEDGNITFGDAPPPDAVNMETIRQHAPGPAQPVAGSANSDYYSPQKQLRRMEANSRLKGRDYQQRRKAARQSNLLQQQAIMQRRKVEKERQIHRARCRQYRTSIDEYEHKTIQAYRNEADHLSDKSQLARLKKLEIEHCN